MFVVIFIIFALLQSGSERALVFLAIAVGLFAYVSPQQFSAADGAVRRALPLVAPC